MDAIRKSKIRLRINSFSAVIIPYFEEIVNHLCSTRKICIAESKEKRCSHFTESIVDQINIARKCVMVNFLSAIPTLPPISLIAIDGEKFSINESSDLVAAFPALTSIGITSPSFSIMNSSSELSFGL